MLSLNGSDSELLPWVKSLGFVLLVYSIALGIFFLQLNDPGWLVFVFFSILSLPAVPLALLFPGGAHNVPIIIMMVALNLVIHTSLAHWMLMRKREG